MPEAALTVSSTSDLEGIVQAVAAGEEARSEAPKFESEELDGSRTISYNHPKSSRERLLEALAEAESELSTEQLVTNEQSEEVEIEPEVDEDIKRAVREAAIADAVRDARENFAREQQQVPHLGPQAELQALRAELLPAFQQKIKALTAGEDIAQLKEAASVPLSEKVLDSLLTLPGGAESAVFLMKNAAEVRKLSALPEHMAIAHVAQLANRFNPAVQRRMSAAPPPIRPIGGSATTSAVDLENAPYQVYKREREKQIRARRR